MALLSFTSISIFCTMYENPRGRGSPLPPAADAHVCTPFLTVPNAEHIAVTYR